MEFENKFLAVKLLHASRVLEADIKSNPKSETDAAIDYAPPPTQYVEHKPKHVQPHKKFEYGREFKKAADIVGVDWYSGAQAAVQTKAIEDLVWAESAFRPNARATSKVPGVVFSAFGLFQMTDATWFDQFSKLLQNKDFVTFCKTHKYEKYLAPFMGKRLSGADLKQIIKGYDRPENEAYWSNLIYEDFWDNFRYSEDPTLQAIFGFTYIKGKYQTPERAYALQQATIKGDHSLAPKDLQEKALTMIDKKQAGY